MDHESARAPTTARSGCHMADTSDFPKLIRLNGKLSGDGRGSGGMVLRTCFYCAIFLSWCCCLGSEPPGCEHDPIC